VRPTAGPPQFVSRETSVLDEVRKNELNGSGSTECRNFTSREETHG
jgi:hypothetical protein